MSMPTAAGAFLALWNSIAAPELRREYEAWHALEHVPERVGLPGFLAAARYCAPDEGSGAAPLYFTCYWLAGLQALDHPDYRQVFAAPTPWTARMRAALTRFLRLPCRLAGTHGLSSGAALAVLHLQPRSADAGGPLDAELARLVRAGALVAAHWGRYEETSAIPIANRESGAQPPQPGRDLVVLLHHFDLAALRACAGALAATLAPIAPAARPPQLFTLQTEVRREALPLDGPGRLPPRTELSEMFTRGEPR